MARPREASRVGATAAPPEVGPSEIFKALGDPVRWSIIRQAAEVEELGCSVLERTLHVSKPTISYHTKILVQAGLLTARKEGRNFYYTLRRDVLRALVDDVWSLAPQARPVRGGAPEPRPVRDGATALRAPFTPRRRRPRGDRAAEGAGTEAVLLTW